MLKYISFLFVIILLVSCQPELPDEVEAAMADLPQTIDYNIHVKPILSDRCFACHGPDKNSIKGDLQLHEAKLAYAASNVSSGQFPIAPKKLAKSEVFHRIVSHDSEYMMPPPESNLQLTDREKAVLIKWIQQGAEYKPHWSFIPLEKVAPPQVNQKEWVKNEIDQFVLAQLETKGWSPKAEADKAMLLRRVSFDLTGLPPTLEEMDNFLNDNNPDAYERVVNRLLTSPHYGERMAADWMDVARFADTHGYTVDRYRDMSPWRDWVIQSFNENMSFDKFTIWQMAGDLLPEPDDPKQKKEQILATGFNRNHQQNMEGGIVDEEFRVEYVADRTNTLGAAFLGLTLECARCHDHKYDPISQKEYYQLYSFFNNVKEAGQISFDNAMPVPTMLLTDEAMDETIAFINHELEEQEQAIEKIKASAKSQFESWAKTDRLKINPDQTLLKSKVAHFDFNNNSFTNRLQPNQKGEMKQQHASSVEANLVDGQNGNALLLDGDAWFDLNGIGAFDRTMPFSVGLWVWLPRELKNGVIFHKGEGAALYNFRGFHMALKDNQLELLMAHTTPYNAIIEYGDNLPREQWIHLMMTHDGSGKAAGLKAYLNGEEYFTKVDQDNLYKGIMLNRAKEPGLQVGARWRGIGIKGAMVDDIEVYNNMLTGLEVRKAYELTNPESDSKLFANQLFRKDFTSLSANEKALLTEWYLKNQIEKETAILENINQLRTQKKATLDTLPEIMVMEEMPTPRQSYILERGQYNVYGEEVYPATPEAVLQMPETFEKNRLGLAKWIVHEGNPLTARVIVNRFWQQCFGTGLVKTTEDFGNQGDLPSHPELLDWLAVEFIQSGWDVKALLKKIVMSATYRQSSIANESDLENDVENIWLSRGPSARLNAEMIRDNALAASGLLVYKIGGKSVKPYQPDGLWRVNGTKYTADKGEGLYRRSLYTFWKRTIPNPTQATFDAPTRSGCTVKRQETSTPLQALVLLNDPTFTEAAKLLGVEITAGADLKQSTGNAFRKLTGRKASPKELDLLLSLQQSELEKFQKNPEKIKGWLGSGESIINFKELNLDEKEIAANTVIATTIINSDAAIVKR